MEIFVLKEGHTYTPGMTNAFEQVNGITVEEAIIKFYGHRTIMLIWRTPEGLFSAII